MEFPGSEETTDVTFPEAHHIRALTQLPLSPPPICPVLSLVRSLPLPEPPSTPLGKKAEWESTGRQGPALQQQQVEQHEEMGLPHPLPFPNPH